MKIYQLPKLNYNYDALEPFIDKKTMEIHYLKHHQNYTDNLNSALSKYPQLIYDLDFLLKNLSLIPEDIRILVRNNGGGYFNHTFFWKILKLSNSNDYDETIQLKKLVKENFGNLENFKNQFLLQAKNLFGSGWTWLILDFKNQLKIVVTSNQDTPLDEGHPLLAIDLWEHSYYLSYQNRRVDYIEAFYNVINWNQVDKNLQEALISNSAF
ncbi:superoxide dismutase [Candidatus Phytoplasma pini]|uniref:Superoxide dismutase n=1 Tax=Candidatus Phytoplasma pini TaxID=267362 RepID=A0A559KK18_9MOLU|nr:superoxide dismutase [Candidatus Phytoplasma pini]TVY12459.1 Superoxide dismutase (Mn) [Candidatus Phytoplasma pini]